MYNDDNTNSQMRVSSIYPLYYYVELKKKKRTVNNDAIKPVFSF